ncbi:MAG TPA: helix-turn-helix domain-containing protein [Dermatophilaceae bacterium]|nr:helix-turn-helix domain-containing protein [Dermatophilaceae bacterium]
MIDAEISDAAFRLYALLLRYGNGSGSRMPSRPTLARRLRRSVDAVDRAMRQLTDASIVRVEHRRVRGEYLSNRYHVRTSQPGTRPTFTGDATDGAHEDTSYVAEGGGRISAATPEPTLAVARGCTGAGGRISAATPGRTSAARVAADLRPNPKVLTQRTPPPPSPSPAPSPAPGAASSNGTTATAIATATATATVASSSTAVEAAEADLLAACGITDLEALARRCAEARRALGKPTTRWSARCLAVVVKLAVVTRGWPPAAVPAALLAVAADPASHSPARVAEAGPWWDAVILGLDHPDAHVADVDLVGFEARLAETGGLRPVLQAQARAELAAEGMPVVRRTVARRACQILERQKTP